MNDPREKLDEWTVEDNLAFDIVFALPRGPVRGLRRALTEDERHGIAIAPSALWVAVPAVEGCLSARRLTRSLGVSPGSSGGARYR